jgi:hypothetical protein
MVVKAAVAAWNASAIPSGLQSVAGRVRQFPCSNFYELWYTEKFFFPNVCVAHLKSRLEWVFGDMVRVGLSAGKSRVTGEEGCPASPSVL